MSWNSAKGAPTHVPDKAQLNRKDVANCSDDHPELSSGWGPEGAVPGTENGDAPELPSSLPASSIASPPPVRRIIIPPPPPPLPPLPLGNGQVLGVQGLPLLSFGTPSD